MLHLENGFTDPTEHAQLLALQLHGSTPNTRQPTTADISQALKSPIKAVAKRSHQAALFLGRLYTGVLWSPACGLQNPHQPGLVEPTCQQHHRYGHHSTQEVKDLPAPSTPPIHIGTTNTATCPVRARQHALSQRLASSHAPLFTFQDGTFLTPKTVSSLRLAGYNPAQFSSCGYIRIHGRLLNTEAGQMKE